MSELLNDLIAMLGHEPVNSTAQLTAGTGGHEASNEADLNLGGQAADRVDRLDRENTHSTGKLSRGPFEVGRSYRTKVVARVLALTPGDRAATDTAGFGRAGAVVIEGVGLLVDDVARLMVDGRFLVLGFVDVPAGVPQGTSAETRRGR